MLSEANFLILDEPTNHLDMRAITWLAHHLKSRWKHGTGALLVVTHDRWFLDRIATHILSFEGDSKVVFYEGSYSEYEEWKKAQGGDTQPHRVKYRKLVE